MPADRRIVVNVSEPGYRDPALQGEWVPGAAITAIGVWASQSGPVGQELKVLSGKVLVMKQAVTGVFAGMLESLCSPTNLLQVVDGGENFLVTNMVEVTAATTRRARPTPKVPGPSGDTRIMKWPFGKDLETRAESSYGDAVIAALVGRAEGRTLAVPSGTGALEACSGLVGRAFAASEVAGADSLTRVLTPGVLEMIGRSLIRQGEIVFYVDSSSGSLRLVPAETHDVVGGPFPEEWEYHLTLGGPSRTVTYDDVPAQSVLHFRYAADPATPWRGNGPIQVAALAGRLSAETVRALGDEASGTGRPTSWPLPGVSMAQDSTVEALAERIFRFGSRPDGDHRRWRLGKCWRWKTGAAQESERFRS